MKKTFELEDLDCAKDATVSYIAQKLTLEADDGRFEEILKEVVKVCKAVEPDCTILLK